MNCQDHLYRAPTSKADHAALVFRAMRRRPRRDGARASPGSKPATRPAARPAGAEAAAFRAEGEASHLSVHGRRAQPSGTVRLQARTREV